MKKKISVCFRGTVIFILKSNEKNHLKKTFFQTETKNISVTHRLLSNLQNFIGMQNVRKQYLFLFKFIPENRLQFLKIKHFDKNLQKRNLIFFFIFFIGILLTSNEC